METRALGATGLEVSVLGFGCGAVGGLMVRGEPSDQERAVARAVECGITYFDTAPSYGDGRSETNLGRVLATLRPSIVLGTKFSIDPAQPSVAGIGAAITASLDMSLRRLGREQVDILQLHNAVGGHAHRAVPVATVVDHVVPALQRLQADGKIRAYGFTAIGDTTALHQLVASGAMQAAQVSCNLLNPSAATHVPQRYPAQDYGELLQRMAKVGMGAIGIRALAGGALSATETRHAIGSPPPEPIGSGADYIADVARARRLEPLVAEGHAGSLIEASLRFVMAQPAIATVLVGVSSLEQLETAVAAIERGPLSSAALSRLAKLQAAFVGEAR